MIENDHTKFNIPKPSEYNVYKNLNYQQENNPKNKFDNRLYTSLRYKNMNYNTKLGDEIFDNSRLRNLIRLNVKLYIYL